MSLAPPAISASGWLRALERSAAEAATGRLPASASRLWDREAGCRQSVGNGPTRGRPLHMLHPGCGLRISASSGGPVCSFFNHSFIHLLKCSCFTLLCQFLRYCTVNQPRVCVCVCVRACVRARVSLFGSPAHSLHHRAPSGVPSGSSLTAEFTRVCVNRSLPVQPPPACRLCSC